MNRRAWLTAVLVALVTAGLPALAGAETKLAILKVKGMVCPA